MNNTFEKDFNAFNYMIKNENDSSKIKKIYIQLVKKYHPDTVSVELKECYTEYSILINKAYSTWKQTNTHIKFNNSCKSRLYSFFPKSKFYSDMYGKKFKNYNEYLLTQGKDFYWYAHDLLYDKQLSQSDIKTNSSNIIAYLYKAKLCFLKILQQPDIKNNSEYKFMIYNEIDKINYMSKYLGRGLTPPTR